MQDAITLFEDDLREVRIPHDDYVVILLTILNYDITRILANNRSSVDILFYDAFQRMKLPYEQLHKINSSLVEFIGNLV